MFESLANLSKSITSDPDSLIVNRYKLKRFLGKGAMGEVYCAIDRNLGDLNVAIKFLSQSVRDEEIRLRFESEAKISALLGEQSDHIVKVKDYGLNENDIPFYVMELLQGSSLDKIIKKNTLSLKRFLSLTRQICLALKSAHNGIVVNGELASIIHRDIKPSNIFLTNRVDLAESIKILDFGIAQIVSDEQSETSKFMGTFKYCSPEQMDEKELDLRSDIYSLGVTMYEMLARDIPIKSERNNFQSWYHAHHNNTPKALPSYLNLPSDLNNIIMQCLEKSPENRPKNVTKILKVITFLEKTFNSGDKSFFDQKITNPKKISYGNLLPLQEKYLQASWPSHKPQDKIVFPLLTESKEGKFVSLWTMLENQDIAKFNPLSTFCYHHFVLQASPHPILLWVNVIYTQNHEPRWLNVYLDLKTKSGYKMVRSLIASKFYHILLFELHKPQKYQQILNVNISDQKRNKLKLDLQKINFSEDTNQPEVSKRILKEKIEQIKVTILKSINKSSG